MNTSLARPLVPEDRYRSPAARHSLQHAAFAAVMAAARNIGPTEMCSKIYPDDPVALALLTRAATTGATTTVPAWAGNLVPQQLSAWLGSLAPASAAAALIGRGILLPSIGPAMIAVPLRATAPTADGWVGEGGAIPVRSWTFTTVDLGPRKMAVMVVLSKELATNSAALPIFNAVLDEEAALSLDAAYFSATAASASAHAGLLAGLVAGTGSAVMANDLAALAEAVGTNGSGQVVFVMGPGRAAACAVRQPAEATATVLPSLAVPEDRVICIDPGALVHGFGGDVPEIIASQEATIVMRDDPTDIGVPGSPPVVAAPTQSMFQVDSIALRLLVDVAFIKRRSGAVAFIDGCTW